MIKPLLLIGALCACSVQAKAQNGVEFYGDAPPLEQLPLSIQLKIDPKLPPYPKLETTQPARLDIRVLQTYRGPVFQLEVVRKSVGEVLEAVVAPTGARAVVDPDLKKWFFTTAVFRALSLEELLLAVSNPRVETWKSSSGVYFFADKPSPVVLKLQEEAPHPAPQFRDRDPDPFVLPFGKPVQPSPQPDWRPFEFNGRKSFFVPLPNVEK